MYSVHAVVFKTLNGETTRHEVLIHDNMSPIHEQHLIDPKLKLADLDAGSFTAVIPPYNPGYSLVERFNSIIKIHKGTNLIWTGRVITETMDFWNRRSISCEGALAFLNDTVQPIAFYGNGHSPAYILAKLLEVHNNKVVADRKLYVGAVSDFPEDDYEAYIFQTNNGSTMEELKNNLTNRIDCHLSMHYTNGKAYIDIFRDYPNVAPQQINFGDNLLDFTRDWNLSGLTTTILPRGKALDAETNEGQKTYLNLKSTTDEFDPIPDGTYSIGSNENAITVDGLYIVNNVLYSQYGRVEKIVDFSDSDNPNDLFIMAKNYLSGMQFDDMTLKVSAIDLHNLTNDIVSFNLLDQVYCISKPHGLYGQFFPIVEIDIPLDHPENVTYTMSNNLQKNTMTGVFGAFKSSVSAAFKGLTTTGHILDLARVEASEILNRKTTGYVNVINMHENEEEGVAQAIVISSTPNWRESNKYWIWNMNGLGYYDSENSARIAENAASAGRLPSNTTEDGTVDSSTRYYSMAITMDGTIVADRVKTGVLSDGMGYNYWNLETGEFRLQPNTQLNYGTGENEHVSLFDLIYDTDKAVNKRTGAANYLNGSKDWSDWRMGGSWRVENEEAICNSKSTTSWDDIIKSPIRDASNIPYDTIKGYTMTFSIEGASDEEWGELSPTNAFVVSFCLVNSSGVRLGHCDKVFSFDTDYSRRYTTIDMVDESFIRDSSGSYSECYIDIWLYNRSTHGLAIRRPQFERGNTPTDWSISDFDIDREAENKATTAYSAAVTVARSYATSAQTNSVEEAERLDKLYEKEMQKYVNKISESDREYSDGVKTAIEQSMTQRELLRRLTNNFQNSGIYLENGELLINADFIRTGALDAAIITTGVIRDQYDTNKWDLTKGYFESRNAQLMNANVEGSITAGRDVGGKAELYDGSLTFYWDNQSAGRITTQRTGNINWLTVNGDCVDIRGRQITIQGDSINIQDNNQYYNTYSIVTNIWYEGDSIGFETGTLEVRGSGSGVGYIHVYH